jgi:hypothetical protein
MECRYARPWAPRWMGVVFASSVGMAVGCSSSEPSPIDNTPNGGGALGALFQGVATWCACERETGVDARAERSGAGEKL